MYYIYERGYFWTGKNWTEYKQFAKIYFYYGSAFQVCRKRFIKRRVSIRPCADFEKKKTKTSESRLQL